MAEPAIAIETVRQRDRQVARVVGQHLAFVWRTLRRLGVIGSDLEDATQRVFIIVSKKLSSIEPGCERSFVFGTAMRVASCARRQRNRRREQALDSLRNSNDPSPDPEANAERSQAVEIMARILERMSEEMRTVFVLFELEQMTMAEISAMLDVPAGTVASRLRRARRTFREEVRRVEAVDGRARR